MLNWDKCLTSLSLCTLVTASWNRRCLTWCIYSVNLAPCIRHVSPLRSRPAAPPAFGPADLAQLHTPSCAHTSQVAEQAWRLKVQHRGAAGAGSTLCSRGLSVWESCKAEALCPRQARERESEKEWGGNITSEDWLQLLSEVGLRSRAI